MIFYKRRDTPQLDLLLNNIKIEQVPNFTFLGIIFDTSLSWKCHTKIIAIKVSKIIGIYFSERNFINNIQITNYATFELWSERHISSSEESHTISDALFLDLTY